jgi:hypothetical protein
MFQQRLNSDKTTDILLDEIWKARLKYAECCSIAWSMQQNHEYHRKRFPSDTTAKNVLTREEMNQHFFFWNNAEKLTAEGLVSKFIQRKFQLSLRKPEGLCGRKGYRRKKKKTLSTSTCQMCAKSVEWFLVKNKKTRCRRKWIPF